MKLLRAELRKLWTVRAPKVLLGAAAMIAILSAVIQIAVIENRDGAPTLSSGQVAGILAGAAAAVPMVMFIGAAGSTSEVRHRTDYLNHLIAPGRWPYALARLGAYLVFGAVVAVVMLSVLLLSVFVWAEVRAGGLVWGSTPTRILGGVALSTVAYTIIGLAVGSIFRNQTVAVSVLAAWVFLIEGILVLPLVLIDLRLGSIMPIQALQVLLIDDALVGTGIGEISYGVWPTVGIILAWTVGLSIVGMWRTLTSEIR